MLVAGNSNLISYEYPLNERVRTMLRLEDLCARIAYFQGGAEPFEHHVAVALLFDVLEVAGRADLKSDLLQELERQRQVLEALRDNPAISVEALDSVLSEIDRTSARLYHMSGKFGQDLRDNEWLMGIKQRTSLPGGVCEFDLPSYHYWLNRDSESRRSDIAGWFGPFQPIRDGIAIVLRLLRESGKSTRQVAQHGMFQQMMAGRPVQLLRLRLPRDVACVPEISANKHALNIRFTTASGRERPRTSEADVEFDLMFCNL